MKLGDRQRALLDEAISLLDRHGADARDPLLRRALGAIDELRDALRRQDPHGSAALVERLQSARLDLNLGDPEGALEALTSLRDDA